MSLLLTFLLLSIAIQFGYWIFLFQKILGHKSNPQEGNKSASIIISAKNEAKNLQNNLPKIFAQKESNFEVIVANDHSTDTSGEILQKLSEQQLNLIFFTPNVDIPGKKGALTEAIQRAKTETLLLTDADCWPASNQWAKKMTAQFSKRIQIVLGYSPLKKGNGWLNRWARFETWLTGLQYLSFALAEMPYMGVGRNLAYTKSRFNAVKGFAAHNDLVSGDDDLFVNQAASPYNTAICIDPDAWTYSLSPENWNAYFNQKRRHYTVSHRYKSRHKWFLSAFSFTHLLIYLLLFIYAFISPIVAIVFYLLYILPKWYFARKLLILLNEKDLIRIFPALDLFFAVYLVVMAPFLKARKNNW